MSNEAIFHISTQTLKAPKINKNKKKKKIFSVIVYIIFSFINFMILRFYMNYIPLDYKLSVI